MEVEGIFLPIQIFPSNQKMAQSKYIMLLLFLLLSK